MSGTTQAAVRRQGERFLVVRLAGKEFALETRRILGMMQMRGLPFEAAEGPPGWDAVVELHGKKLPVYTPNPAAGLPARPVTSRSCLVVLAGAEGRHQPRCCLRVDSISRFEELKPRWIREDGERGRAVKLSQKWRPVVDVERIAAEAAFYEWTAERRATTS